MWRAMSRRPAAWAGAAWLAGLIAAAGLAIPLSMPVAGPLAAHARPTSVAPQAGAEAAVLRQRLAAPGADAELAGFYAARRYRPLWTAEGRLSREARRAADLVARADADGLDPQAYDPADLSAALDAAASRRAADLAQAELTLTRAFAAYAADLHRPAAGAAMLYSDRQFQPVYQTPRQALAALNRAADVKAGLAAVTHMNPIYAHLRAELAAERARGGGRADLIRANLERARALPPDLGRRYILVDVAAQRLWAYEDGVPVDNMRVVVGKPGEPTPAMAALVRYAVFRPYWNVPPDLVARSLAPKVLKQGVAVFKAQNLEALSDWSDKPRRLDPARVNWRAVASGRGQLRVRQLPGPDNMMGEVKFMFPNERGVYLHDSPLKALFEGDERTRSAGCVRLEDALRLARWLVGDAAVDAGRGPGPAETRVDLAAPVPVYLLYLTAAPTEDGLSVRRDVYRRDAQLIARLNGAGPSEVLAAASLPGTAGRAAAARF
jgi:murein L,D-transpeptidase YcbB/YkuD